MHILLGLPRKAHIISEYRDLEIENHKVTNPSCIMGWLLGVIARNEWRYVLSQMISQGFKLDGVIEQCIADMQDPKKFARILYELGRERYSHEKLKKLISTGLAKPIQQEITARLKACQNWDQLFHAINRNSVLLKKMFREWSSLKI